MNKFSSIIFDQLFDWSLDYRHLRDVYLKTSFDTVFRELIAEAVAKNRWPQCPDDDRRLKALLKPFEDFVFDGELAQSDEKQQRTSDINNLHNKRRLEPADPSHRIINSPDVPDCSGCLRAAPTESHQFTKDWCDCEISNVDQPNECQDEQSNSRVSAEDKQRMLDKIAQLPRGMGARYFLICQSILNYANAMLTWECQNSLPDELMELHKSQFDPDLYYLILLSANCKPGEDSSGQLQNQVAKTLVKVLGCSERAAETTASNLKRDGLTILIKGSRKSCEAYRDAITSLCYVEANFLRAEVIQSHVLAHKVVAINLVDWLGKQSQDREAFKILTAFTLLSSHHNRMPVTLIEKVMLSSLSLWEVSRVKWSQLISKVLMSQRHKSILMDEASKLIIRLYPKLIEDFMRHNSTTFLKCANRYFDNDFAIVSMLMVEENALEIFLRTLFDTFMRGVKQATVLNDGRSSFIFNQQATKKIVECGIVCNLQNLIRFLPPEWNTKLRTNIVQAVGVFLDLIASIQDMCMVQRNPNDNSKISVSQVNYHELKLELEFLESLDDFTKLLAGYCASDQEVLMETLRQTQTKSLETSIYKLITRDLLGRKVDCIDFNVSKELMQTNLHLTRFTAALLLQLMMKLKPSSSNKPLDVSAVMLTSRSSSNDNKLSIVVLMESTLRFEVMKAQCISGLWSGNGDSLAYLIDCHQTNRLKTGMYDKDLIVLQECGAFCEPNEFVIHLMSKFQLLHWLNSSNREQEKIDLATEAQEMSLREEFLKLLLTVISERHAIGLGEVKPANIIKNRVIQFLCLGPASKEAIASYLNKPPHRFMDILAEVATEQVNKGEAIYSNLDQGAQYHLNEQYYHMFNPFFYLLNRHKQYNAVSKQLDRLRSRGADLICCPPPKPVKLTWQFKNLNELLKCDVTLTLIGKILTRCKVPSRSKSRDKLVHFTTSEHQLELCLHLIGLGLYEQERDPLGFNYLQSAYDSHLFVLLKECYEKTSRTNDLILWVLRKSRDLVGILLAQYLESLDADTIFMAQSVRDCLSTTCDVLKLGNKRKGTNSSINSVGTRTSSIKTISLIRNQSLDEEEEENEKLKNDDSGIEVADNSKQYEEDEFELEEPEIQITHL